MKVHAIVWERMKRKRQLWKILQYFLFWTIIVSMFLNLSKTWYVENEKEIALNTLTKNKNTTIYFPYAPFEENQAKLLVIVTYQRSGSTFLGSFFNQNPDAFYMFEPLDSFYSAFYGTPMLWNVPSDITSYSNGSQRLLPEMEINGVIEFLSTLLSCDMSSLPAETLLHPYLYYYRTDQYLAADKYIKCIEKHQKAVDKCSALVPRSYCGGRFGEVSDETLLQCHRVVHEDEYRRNHTERSSFEDYVTCTRALKRIITRRCSSLLETECRKRNLRVTKVVRATMDGMGPLLSRFPNFRVIHLLRDPRAVVQSRKDFDSSVRGIFTELEPNEMLLREAKLLCQTMARDVRLRWELEKQYPGKLYAVIYDDLVRDIKGYAKSIYSFLDLEDATDTTWWNDRIGSIQKTDSLERALRWQSAMTYKTTKEIMKECSEFFQLVKYKWSR